MNTVLGHTTRAMVLHKGAIIVLSMIVCLQILVSLALPWPLKLAVDNVLGSEELPWLLGWLEPVIDAPNFVQPMIFLSVAFVALHGLSSLGGLARHYVMARVGTLMRLDLASALLAKLQSMDRVFYAKERVGDLVQRLTDDTRFTADLLAQVLMPGLTAIGTLVAMIWVLASLSVTLAVVALLAAIPVPLLIRYYSKPITDRSYEQQERLGDVMAAAEQSITSIQVVQAFAQEGELDRRFRARTSRAVQAVLRATSVQLSFDFFLGLVNALGRAGGLVVGGYLALDGTITIGTLLVALAYLEAVIGPVGSLASIAAAYGTASGKGRRIIEILDRETGVVDRPGAERLPSASAGQGRTIEMQGVRFAYPGGPDLLSNVDLALAAGETVALVGPTGVGKSTFANLLMRLFDPKEGRILIDGRDLRDIPLADLRQGLSVVLQDAFLLPLSVGENIRLGRPDATDEEVETAARIAQAHSFITELPHGYDTIIGEQGATLSGGQKQRLAFARAMLRDTPVIILDEPSSSLDVETEAAMFEALQQYKINRTVLLIAHRPATLKFADRILELRDGRLVEKAKPRSAREVGA
ncbi:ABC transporter ATP-binding protein [Tateyamaria pelophila]|uniref:ABC transporter ATP-binding protein n=1 Tax=Tateyamaria pelophila TaxID=328415 RepID=UPI001CBC65B0|nr:ABC transporter ATP-binding protein [Tateyamaria pelophila]